MESVKSIVKDVVYGKSKIHTDMEFTFSNNNSLSFHYETIEVLSSRFYNYSLTAWQIMTDLVF